mgnify:CR=1 FL=1
MFTQNLKNHRGGVWLYGSTATEKADTQFEGYELISLFENQDNLYADLNLYDEGEYTFSVSFNRHSNCDVYVGYWYMDNGSFEPQLHTISQLFCGEAFTFTYKKTIADRYYGSLILFADPSAYDTHDYIEQTFENASLDISFASFPKSVCNPLVLISNNSTKEIIRHRIENITLRGLKLPDGSIVCDKLELRSGQLIRFISPNIDNCISPETHPQDFLLPIAVNENCLQNCLPKLENDSTISSNVEIELFPA